LISEIRQHRHPEAAKFNKRSTLAVNCVLCSRVGERAATSQVTVSSLNSCRFFIDFWKAQRSMNTLIESFFAIGKGKNDFLVKGDVLEARRHSRS